MPRFVLIAAAVLSTTLVTMPSVKSSETQKPAEFVSGTVTSIPARRPQAATAMTPQHPADPTSPNPARLSSIASRVLLTSWPLKIPASQSPST